MFGIGLPELILIMGIALIVVGPERLPDLAKSLAKGMLELKKTAAALKQNLDEEMREELKQDPWKQNLDAPASSEPHPAAVGQVVDPGRPEVDAVAGPPAAPAQTDAVAPPPVEKQQG
ncbi:MAG: twin-arginine translocase TatA/TatE family subunit [Thermodesulfobacteriota bacterium]